MNHVPVPQGKYVPASRFENLIFTSGMTPRKDGILQFSGKILSSEPIETYREAVRLAACNALTAAKSKLSDDECLGAIVSLTVYIAAEEGFIAHAQLADFASAYYSEEMRDCGIGSRAAIGVASLPGNAPVEIQLVAAVSSLTDVAWYVIGSDE